MQENLSAVETVSMKFIVQRWEFSKYVIYWKLQLKKKLSGTYLTIIDDFTKKS